MNQITMPQKTKITLLDLSNEILTMMKDYFVAKFMQNGTNLTIEFNNGQRFEINLKMLN